MHLRKLFRAIIYAPVLMRLKSHGSNITLAKGGVIKRPEELEIGNNVFIGQSFHISARSMKIGNDVMIGPNFLAECDDHIFDKVGVTMFSVRDIRKIAPIRIENDVWIGGNVTLLKGVTIAEGSIIGAGSVVTKDIPPYSICFGTPCRPFKSRFQEQELHNHLEKVRSNLSLEEVLINWRRVGLSTDD